MDCQDNQGSIKNDGRSTSTKFFLQTQRTPPKARNLEPAVQPKRLLEYYANDGHWGHAKGTLVFKCPRVYALRGVTQDSNESLLLHLARLVGAAKVGGADLSQVL